MSTLRSAVPVLVVTLAIVNCTVDREKLSGGLAGSDVTGTGASPGQLGSSAGSNGGIAASGSGEPGASGPGQGSSGGGNSGGRSSTSSGGTSNSSGGDRGSGTPGSAGTYGSAAAGSSTGGSSTGGSSTGGSSTASAGTAGVGMAGAGGASVASLPFAVDTYFSASGALGDAASVQLQSGAGNCRSGAMASAGQCWRIDFNADAAGVASGYFWQYPANNAGQSRGLLIEAGAKQVLFSATGDKGGEQVTFFVGGIGSAGTAYRDAFRVERLVTLTTAPQTLKLDLSAVTYTNVIGGFGFTVSPGAADKVRFFVSGIQWTK